MDKEIKKSIEVINKGGVFIYPTDTVWGIGCDATNNKAIDRIISIKKRNDEKSFIVLLDSITKLERYIEKIPPIAIDMIEQFSQPLTIIYPKGKKLSKKVMANDGSVAIRIVKENNFCQNLIKDLDKAIVSTSVNISGARTPLHFTEINKKILESVDYVVDPKLSGLGSMSPSTIIKFDNFGTYEIIRE